MNYFAQLGLAETALTVLRVIAAIGGAFVGWFVSDPLARIGYRIAKHKPIPGWTLPWLKMASALLAGLLVYFFIPLGGDPGGWGYGPGLGGGAGQGPGQGGKDSAITTPSTKTDERSAKRNAEEKAAIVRKPVEIEVLGGKRYPGEERYYLLKSTGKAMTLNEVEAYFKEHGAKLELHVVLTDDSPDEVTGVTAALTRLADRYEIPSLIEAPKRSGS
jgi:hypothetical protein